MTKQNKVMISLRLPKKLIDEMSICCGAFMFTRTSLIERAVHKFILDWWGREGTSIKDFERYKAHKKWQFDVDAF